MNIRQAWITTKQNLDADLVKCCGECGFVYLFKHLLHAGFLVCFFYRVARFFYWIDLAWIAKLVTFWGRVITSCDVHYKADIAGGILFPHGRGVVIGEGVKIGRDCFIFQNATIGSREGQDGYPVLEEGVNVYPSVVVAGPITIGEYCRVGPCVYLTDSLPSHTRVKPPNPIIRPSHD